MIKIKLSPRGKKHQITYRVVVIQDKSKLNGDFIDDLGFYTPQTKTFSIDKEKLADWQKKGAQLALGVDKLLNPEKYPKKIKTKKEAKIETVKSDEKIEETKAEESKVEEVKEEAKVEA